MAGTAQFHILGVVFVFASFADLFQFPPTGSLVPREHLQPFKEGISIAPGRPPAATRGLPCVSRQAAQSLPTVGERMRQNGKGGLFRDRGSWDKTQNYAPHFLLYCPPVRVVPKTTEGEMAVTRIPIPDWARVQEADNRLELSLAETELAVRTVNCLEEQGIFLVRDVLNCTPERLLEIPNFGQKTLEAVFDALEKLGFSRRPGAGVGSQGNFALLSEGEES
jgi:DNA-directed RNA polymerase subunit alpha